MTSKYLLSEQTTGHYRQAVVAAVDRVVARLNTVDGPFTGASPHLLDPQISAIELDRPLGDTDTALDELDRVYLRDAVYFHHPRYLAHLNCPVAVPAVMGEAVIAAINSSMDTWDQSAGATLVERHLIDWTARRIGLGDAADGVFTSGGTQSNLQALLLAREEAARRAGHLAGHDVLARLRVFTSPYGHFSVVKAASLLGLDPDAVVTVPADQYRRMRAVALDGELRRCRERGLIPMAVVATAGTTDFGSIDPLAEIAERCARAQVWLHVDAAYGCGLLVSRRRALLTGIERADSVTVDFHKSFFQPVSSSAVLVRDATTLRHATYHADYLNPRRAADGLPNQVDKSLQTTRRFDALKLWLTLRIMGPDAIGALFDQVIDLAAQAWRLLDGDPRFEVVAEPQLSTLVFRYVPAGELPPGLVDHANLHARDTLARSGAAMVAATTVHGRHYLKFTLLNPCTTVRDIADVLDLIAAHAHDYLGDARVYAS